MDFNKTTDYKTKYEELLKQYTSLETQLVSLKNDNAALKQLANTDPLTLTLSRRVISDIDKDLNHYTIAMFDVDNFKYVNDNFGHQFGDKILKQIASILSKHKRSQDLIIRYGGDEFILVYLNCELESAKQHTELARQEIFELGLSTKTNISVSVGIIENNNTKQLFSEVLCCVDQKMYESKLKGKNRITVF